MSTDLSTEVKSASDIISDKIKAEFVNLIPDDKWKELVAKEIERYTTQKRNNIEEVKKLREYNLDIKSFIHGSPYDLAKMRMEQADKIIELQQENKRLREALDTIKL